MDLNVNNGRFVLINESSGNACCLSRYRGCYNASRSTCYRVRRELSRNFPEEVYVVYRLVRLVR